MNSSPENWDYATPLKSPATLRKALQEQDCAPEIAEELLPVLLRLNEWEAPRPTVEASRGLLARLASQLPRPSPVRQQMLQKQTEPGSRFMGLLLVARQQVGIMRLSFWLLSAFVTCLGFFLLLDNSSQNQMVLLRIGGPLLAYMAALSAFRGINQGVLEFELACPPSLLQLTLARLIVVLGYDTGLGLLLSATLAAWSGTSFLAITLHWLMPLLLVMGLGLLLTLRLPTLLAASIAYGSWLGVVGASALAEKYGLKLFNLSTSGELALGLAGLALLALALLMFKKALPVFLTPVKFP